MKQISNLPRQVDKKDKTIKFDQRYIGLFNKNKNYEKVFTYNLYLEKNIGDTWLRNKIKQSESKLFKKYGETSKNYLRENLFQNSCIVKLKKVQIFGFKKFGDSLL